MSLLTGFTFKRAVPSSLAKTSRATEERIRNVLGLAQLEPMPQQAARAFQLASNPKATASEFIKVIGSDETLSSRVMRIANSVYFFRGTHANDLEKAVANIGLDELRCLLTATLLRSLVHGKHSAREQLWANAVATAIGARSLQRYAPHLQSGQAFLCGLVHDIGKLIIIRRDGGEYKKVLSLVSSGQHSFIDAEEKVFDINHVEVGQWGAEQWNFPQTTIETIAFHHRPWPEVKSAQSLTLPLLVKIADTMAHALGIGHPSGFKSLEKSAQENLEMAYQILGIQRQEGTEFLVTFQREFEREYGLYQVEPH